MSHAQVRSSAESYYRYHSANNPLRSWCRIVATSDDHRDCCSCMQLRCLTFMAFVPVHRSLRPHCVCRRVHVQLRKTERRNEDLKVDCEELEEQVSQLSSELRQAHDDLRRLGSVEDELATAKQISIKLHDECERLNCQCQLYRQQLDVGSERRSVDTISAEASLD